MRDQSLVNQQLLDELDGSRRVGAEGRAAVRLDDLNGLLAMSETLTSANAAGATPTAAEHNALVADVVMIHTRLRAIVDALRTRRRR